MLAEFFEALQNWKDDFSIGEVYLVSHLKYLLKRFLIKSSSQFEFSIQFSEICRRSSKSIPTLYKLFGE